MDKKIENKFDPSVEYAWSPTEIFPLSGIGLHVLYNGLSESLSTPEAQKVLRDYQMFQVVQGILSSQVEEGKAVPKNQMIETMNNSPKGE